MPSFPPELQPAQPFQASATTESRDIIQSAACSYAGGDEFNVLGSPKEPLLSELRDLGQQLRECGILPYNLGIAPGVCDKIHASEGPETAMLFDHFCHKTAPWLMEGECHDNPVLRHIVPLTIMDDLVLHTVLAISGTHLQHSSPSISSLASKHYSYALHSLKQRLADWLSGSDEDYKPLFATIILLCHCEFIQGNTYGAAMQHLRACREFVEAALEHLHESEHRDFVVYLVKNYGYFVLVTNLRGSLQVDNIRLGLEFSTYIMLKIKKFSAIGPMFDFEPEGISLIPQIAQLAWQRKQSPSASDYQVCQATYVRLLESLNRELQQCLSGKVADTQSSSGLKLWNTRQLVISIKINTLLMFLHASFPQHDGRPTLITGLLQPLIDRTMMLLTHVDEANACYSLFWPILVMGSYVRDRAKQGLLVSRLETNQSRMQYLSGGIELLQWLWEDQDGMNFGLEGLETVAAARGVHLCIC